MSGSSVLRCFFPACHGDSPEIYLEILGISFAVSPRWIVKGAPPPLQLAPTLRLKSACRTVKSSRRRWLNTASSSLDRRLMVSSPRSLLPLQPDATGSPPALAYAASLPYQAPSRPVSMISTGTNQAGRPSGAVEVHLSSSNHFINIEISGRNGSKLQTCGL
jgi:hypothetical protein